MMLSSLLLTYMSVIPQKQLETHDLMLLILFLVCMLCYDTIYSITFLYLLFLAFGILPSTALPIFTGTSELPSQQNRAARHLRSLLRWSTVIAGRLLHTQLKFKHSFQMTRALC